MMEVAILFLLAPFVMVVAIVGLVQAGRTVRHYVDWRMRLAERQLERGSASMRAAIDELRAEIASMKQRETEAIFSFDSSLERLEARMNRLEQRAMPDAAAEHAPLGAGTHRVEPPDRLTAKTR
jgi:hypothetical protein